MLLVGQFCWCWSIMSVFPNWLFFAAMDFSITIQIWWKFHSAFIRVVVKWLQWNFAHGTTAVSYNGAILKQIFYQIWITMEKLFLKWSSELCKVKPLLPRYSVMSSETNTISGNDLAHTAKLLEGAKPRWEPMNYCFLWIQRKAIIDLNLGTISLNCQSKLRSHFRCLDDLGSRSSFCNFTDEDVPFSVRVC